MSLPVLRSLFTRRSPSDGYVVVAITSTTELERPELLPPDVQFVLRNAPELHAAFQRVLKDGYGIAVRRVARTPSRLLTAVDRIAERTQGNVVVPWLPTLLEKEEVPLFTREELEQAHADGMDLYEEAKVIADGRDSFRKLVLVDLHDKQILPDHQAVVRQANAVLTPFAVSAMVHRVVLDRSRTKPKAGVALIKALVIIGPLAHVLERWVPGIGVLFAALADNLFTETADAVALRQGGFTWRQLRRRSWTIVPTAILAGMLAWQVGSLVQAGELLQAGVTFGLSAVLLPLVALAQSVAATRGTYTRLMEERKVMLQPGQSRWSLAFHQNALDTARIGSLIGILLTPLLAAAVFIAWPVTAANGWVLALLAGAEAPIAWIVVLLAHPIERHWFHKRALKPV